MKKIAALVVVGLLAIGSTATAAPGQTNNGKNDNAPNGGNSADQGVQCSYNGVGAGNPGQYFKFNLAYPDWNTFDAKNIAEYIRLWWAATAGTNDAPNVGAFVQRDCTTPAK